MPASLFAMFVLIIPASAPFAIGLFCIQGAVLGAYPMAVRTQLNHLVPRAEKRATTLSVESLACRLVYGIAVVFFAWSIDVLPLYTALLTVVAMGAVPFLVMLALPRQESDASREHTT
ncbi:MAG: hypothetical protein QF570_19540 [Myxococcota bacterium]|jgi:hypothetical protein|nr:hypothetical protein [Myxococcota bacterium]